MDPLGFALENFDATGKWRDKEDGVTIDPSSTLSDGTKIASPQTFRELLLNRKNQFIGTVTEKLLAYAMGRSVEYYDQPTVRELVRETAGVDHKWSALILGIVNSQPFQMRRVPELTQPAAATVAQAR
jgi:hypothetical protein